MKKLNVWDQPLSESERSIIEKILRDGTLNDTRKWFRHLLRVYDAREASRQGTSNGV